MSTVLQLEKQIAKLEKEKAAARRREAPGVLERIKHAIAVYGFTAEELGVAAPTTPNGPVRAGKKVAASGAARKTKRRFQAYSDGEGNNWTGIGKRPAWFKEALAAGRTLDELKAK
ncbi:H-NS family nucleoid-associated regulatory protein [Variovorax sp. LT1P1]|uniref:H-NS histone family protein n=1 Tax=Variovorax sp. LT1P1 TaxID=3443730 RepID=UPI003F47CB9F